MRFSFDLFWQQRPDGCLIAKKSASQRSGGASPDFHILDLLSWEWRIMYILLLWPRNHIAKMRMEKNLHIKWSLISAEVCLCNTRLSFGFSLIVFGWLAECETASPPCLMITWGVTAAPNPPPPPPTGEGASEFVYQSWRRARSQQRKTAANTTSCPLPTHLNWII